MEPTEPPRSRLRGIAWIVLLLLAAFQSYAHRYAMTPDGIAYLDLSDAVVHGRWADLVNGYWSPLYPALVGIARLIGRPSAGAEFATVHLLNFLLFAGALAAFEYLLRTVEQRARAWPRSIVHDGRAVVGAYVMFGALALTMLSPELPTPDLAVTASVFVAFAAGLQLVAGVAPARNAVVIGVALGAGVLAKSFLVPWSLVYFAVLALGLRRRAWRAVSTSAVVWLAIVLPWCAVLSARVGHATFGDTGRLTYAWYVNDQEAPSLRRMPRASQLTQLDAILPGVGVTDDAPGTNPVWLDPVRFSGALHPHWDASAQLDTLRTLGLFYLKNLSPLIFIVLFAVLLAEPPDRVALARRGWLVILPALAGIAAYGAVVVTTRYIAGFLIAGLLLVGAALRWPQRVTTRRALLAVGIPLALLSFDATLLPMLALMNAVVVALTLAWLLRTRSRWMVVPTIVVVALVVRVVVNPVLPTVVRVAALVLTLGYAALAREAVARDEAERFAAVAGWSVALVIGALIVARAGIRLSEDARASASAATKGNVAARISAALASRGITPGTRIALVGSPYEAYWARAGRLRIVAAVPEPLTSRFWALSPMARDSVLRVLAAHGAQYAVAEALPPQLHAADWERLPRGGAVRRLRP